MVFVRYPLKKENVEKESFTYDLIKDIVYKVYLYILSIDLPTFVFTHKYNTIWIYISPSFRYIYGHIYFILQI